jgi:hypothetical protein
MPGNLDTTNVMLAIIAAVSVIQGLVLLGVGIAAFKLYRAATGTMREIDEKRVQPLVAKVDGILTQVHHLADRVQKRADKVEAAIDDTVGRVDVTATRVKSSVNDTVHKVSDAVTGIRSAIVNALTTEGRAPNGHRHSEPLAHRREPTHTSEHIREGGF